MNKTFNYLTLLITGALLISCESVEEKETKPEAIVVPSEVMASFKREYPGIDSAKWEKEGADFEVVFRVNNREASVVFHPDGVILETETEIDVTMLPESVTNYVLERAGGARIAEASKIIDGHGAVSYEAEVDGQDLLFDEDGSFLREL